MRIDRRLLGWGVFFVIAGAIPLAVRAGVLDPALVRAWPTLWPILLIGWGAGLLLRRTPLESIGGAVAAVVFGVMAGGALSTGFQGFQGMSGCGGHGDAGRAFETQRGSFAGRGDLGVEFSCGTLAIAPVAGSEWSVAGTSEDGRAPDVEVDGDSADIESRGGSGFFGGGGDGAWQVGLPIDPALGLGVTINAGSGTASLAGAHIASANLTVNAGSFRMDASAAADLGDVNGTVNAGSATILLPAGARSANLSLNAGSLDLCLPQGAQARVTWSGALGSNDLDEAGLVSVGNNVWTTVGFDDAQPHLELRVSANAGSFGLSFGGGCDA